MSALLCPVLSLHYCTMFARFSPSISPDKHDLLLPLPHGGRRSPLSRIHSFLVNEYLPTIGTKYYTDKSSSEDELDSTSSHADAADTIIELCVPRIWHEKAKAFGMLSITWSLFQANSSAHRPGGSKLATKSPVLCSPKMRNPTDIEPAESKI